MRTKLATFGALLVLMTTLVGSAYAACSSCCGGVDDAALWTSGKEFIGSTSGTTTTMNTENQPTQIASLGQDQSQTIEPQNIPQNYILVYVSDDRGNLNGYDLVQGTIYLPYSRFLEEDGTLKSAIASSNVLGDAGITEKDNVVLCSDCDYCNDPLLVFQIMSYLGHQGDLKLLEGGSTDWRIAGLVLQKGFSTRQATNYVATLNEEALTEYNEIATA